MWNCWIRICKCSDLWDMSKLLSQLIFSPHSQWLAIILLNLCQSKWKLLKSSCDFNLYLSASHFDLVSFPIFFFLICLLCFLQNVYSSLLLIFLLGCLSFSCWAVVVPCSSWNRSFIVYVTHIIHQFLTCIFHGHLRTEVFNFKNVSPNPRV